ncbi:TonB-dependent receptor [Thalassotalea sp. Y01]|uniref:TonB-dependent receptor n=1 Tax=Thalassotalea sp. Y01 TaxID=2729613 RepID=UPI00145D005C|nr:TonB-dependent receptor [Thalassotalea sp. Y01]NMP16291.1 TonB-dependent receptor [Thalassotalea sp. Y01]
MFTFKRNKLTSALLSAGLVSMSSMAIAAEETEALAEEDVEIIEVTGIRGSLQKAQAIKMSTNSIVEVLSAEDIGKLPDTSVAESLARLPGLAGERRNGRTSGLSVRGFNENYVGTSLNGRELLGMGDNRGVEYDLYPSEIVSNVVVYKTPEAGLVAQGIGGTVDLQTVSPLNADSTLVVNANYEENQEDAANPDFDNDGHRFSLNFVEQFADDTIGVALVLATQETPRQEENFRAWGYADTEDGNKVLGGHDSYVRSALLERDSVAAIIEWAPNDRLNVQLDALYIDFEESDARRGIEEGGPVWGGVNYTATEVEDGLVTAGYWDGFHSVIRNDARSQTSELTTFGLNVDYALNDDWSVELDVSTGEVDKTIFDVESYSGVGRAGVDGRPTAARSWEMTSSGVYYTDHPTLSSPDYTDENLVRLAGPQAWGNPAAAPSDSQDGFVNRPEYDEDLDSVRLSLAGVVEWSIISGIEAGVMYSDRSKSKTNEGDYLTAPEYPGDGPIPNVLGVADLGFIGLGGILAYDSLGLYKSGYYTAVEASLVQNDRLGDTYTVDEEITTFYTKLDLDAEFWGIYMSGNFGIQYVDVDQESKGFSTTSDEVGRTVATPVSGGASYSDVLPTLNLSFEIAENQFIRTAMGKVQTRPRMDQMRPNNQASFSFNDNQINNPDPEGGPWSGSKGNPELKPLEANQFDISYENYYAEDGFFATTFFYKDLTNWHRTGSTVTDFSDVYMPDFHQGTEGQAPATLEGLVSETQDGFEGFVRGYEFQASVPLRLAADFLEGFGLVASYTLLDGELDDGGRIPGLSEETYSLTAYYEYEGFEVRVSGTKRDEFLTETRGTSLALVETENLGVEIWDAQIGYDFSKSGIEWLDGLRVTLQGQNLTDEDDITAQAGDSRQINTFQHYGRNFLLGVNYKF